ncbi:MAG TPA: hypothetical protein VD973_00455 [Symbiobacteriaceae bacterium]|nr:hypothetical protein [Symbiobacteriaceae bacterium]
MIWFLGFLGLVLALLGLWGGPAPRAKRRETDTVLRKNPTISEAWDVLGTPLQDELIKIPEHRPWYAPGGDKRFQRGLMLGLGAGLLVSALTVTFMPRGQTPGQVALDGPGGGKPAAPTQTQTPSPTATQPQTPAPTQPQAPAQTAPVTVTFVVDPGSSAGVIADNLKAQGLITDTAAFLNALSAKGLDTSLKAGTFVIPTGATLDRVIEVLTS